MPLMQYVIKGLTVLQLANISATNGQEEFKVILESDQGRQVTERNVRK